MFTPDSDANDAEKIRRLTKQVSELSLKNKIQAGELDRLNRITLHLRLRLLEIEHKVINNVSILRSDLLERNEVTKIAEFEGE